VRDDVQLRWWLKGFGEKVEIVEPAHLRNEFATMASKMAEKYHLSPGHVSTAVEAKP